MTSTVTDAAVEAACKGYWPHHWPKHMADQDRESISTHMRAALEAYNAHVAALTPPPASELVTVALMTESGHVIDAKDAWLHDNTIALVTRDQAEAREADLLRQLAAKDEAYKDLEHTLDAWFDTKAITEDHINPLMISAAKGYLRTCSSGGMPQRLIDNVLPIVESMIEAGVFAESVTQYTMSLRAEAKRWHKKAMDAGVIVHTDGTTSHPMRERLEAAEAKLAAQGQEPECYHGPIPPRAPQPDRSAVLEEAALLADEKVAISEDAIRDVRVHSDDRYLWQAIGTSMQSLAAAIRAQAEAREADLLRQLAAKDYSLSVADVVAAQLQGQIVTLTLRAEDAEAKLAAQPDRGAGLEAAAVGGYDRKSRCLCER